MNKKISRFLAEAVPETPCLVMDLEIIARYYGTGKWFFQVLAIFNKDGGDRAAARHFVESFRVTGN